MVALIQCVNKGSFSHAFLICTELLARSPRRSPEDHLMPLVAGIAIADHDLSLRDIAAQLDQMHERPPSGGPKWQPSSVRALLEEAHHFGLALVRLVH
jgi:hypothetical protein